MRPAPLQRLGLLVFGLCFAALFAGFAIAEGIGSPSVPSGDVALIQDVPGQAGHISEAQLQRAFLREVAQEGVETTPKTGEFEGLRETALEGLIDAAWIQGEASERGIEVSADEVAAELNTIKATNFKTKAAFEKFLAASHYSTAEITEKARLQLLTEKVQKEALLAVAAPSDPEVADYYETTKSTQFTQPPKYDIRLIVNADEAKIQAAKAALEKDDSTAAWEGLARRYSQDPLGKKVGGLHRSIPAEIGEPLDAAIAAAPTGALLGPVKAKGAYFVFAVQKTTPARVEALATVRPHIIAQLEKQNREEAFKSFAGDYISKWRSRTFCAPGYPTERCANYPGSSHPANAPPACYEAHPVAGIAAPSCPAPVSQLIPALPGSISILSPKGQALPQRPVPESQSSENSTDKARKTR